MFSRLFSMLQRAGISLQVVKIALATGISWYIAAPISHNQYPYFAPIAAILTLQVTVADSLEKAFYRIIGIIGGVAISLLIGHWLSVNGWSIMLAIFIGMTLSNALHLHQQIASQVGISALLVLAFGHSHGYALDRIVETILGSGVAVAVNLLLIPPDATPAAIRYIRGLGWQMAAVLRQYEQLRTEAETGAYLDGLQSARSLLAQLKQSNEALTSARQSVKFTLLHRSRRETVERLIPGMERLEHISLQIRGTARSLLDLKREGAASPLNAGVMEATARCVGLFAEAVTDPSEDVQLRLDTAIEEARSLQRRSFLVCMQQQHPLVHLKDMGSLFTDLGRILDEVKTPVLQEEPVHDRMDAAAK